MARKHISLRLCLLIASLIGLADCRPKTATKPNADRIQAGMSAAKVERMLGAPSLTTTSVVSGSPPKKQTQRIYRADGNTFVIQFDGNDQVVSVGTDEAAAKTTRLDSTRLAGEQGDEDGNAVPDKENTPGPAASSRLSQEQLAAQYRAAAEAGDVKGQYQLGRIYMYGLGGVGKDEIEAERWFRKAAEQGEARAQFQLGNMYWRSWGGLSRDDKQAAAWFRKAAEQGNADGQYNLGELYEYARGGLKRDMNQAVEWYRKAAVQGQANAEFALGDAYEHGQGGLSKDKKTAMEWYRKAADHGNRLARERVE